MKYSLLVLALTLTLALTALLAIANQEKQAVGRPQDNMTEKVADEPQPGGKTETDEPPLLLDDEPPLLLDDEPPLLLDDEPPLLLDDDDGNDSSAEGWKVADNRRCHVCHLNYADEAIALVHAKADIGCTDCHGTCDEHIADESWASGGNGTPPGKMYRRKDIDACCQECHESHDVPAQEVIAHWQQRCPKEPGKTDPKSIVCTDCHGKHRLKERTCKWK